MTKDEIVKALRACGSNCCNDCVCFKKDIPCKEKNLGAADLIEQQAAKIAELEAKVPRWIPVAERLPKKGEDGRRDSNWAHCVVSVMRPCGGSWADGKVGTNVFSAPAMFDVDQKIWHVGTEPAEFTVNALIPLEDSDGGYFVTHWMLYPELPQEENDG